MNLVQISPSIQSAIFMTGAGNLKQERKDSTIQLKCERIQGIACNKFAKRRKTIARSIFQAYLRKSTIFFLFYYAIWT